MWGNLLRPFVAFLIVALITRPIRKLVERKLPDGRLKRILLFRFGRK